MMNKKGVFAAEKVDYENNDNEFMMKIILSERTMMKCLKITIMKKCATRRYYLFM